MYIMTTVYYPNDMADKFIERMMKTMEKYPPDENLGEVVLPPIGRGTKDGIEGLSVSKVNKGKMEEVMILIGKQMREYVDIPGFRYDTKIFTGAEEAMEIYGLGD
jgi:hypothetical protein